MLLGRVRRDRGGRTIVTLFAACFLDRVACPVCRSSITSLERRYLPFDCNQCKRPLMLLSSPGALGALKLVPVFNVIRTSLAIYVAGALLLFFVPGMRPAGIIHAVAAFLVLSGALDLADAISTTRSGIVVRSWLSALAGLARPATVAATLAFYGLASIVLGLVGMLLPFTSN